LYRARRGWLEYARQLDESTSPLERTAAWYAERFVPFFSVRSFVYSRMCEYEADKDAAMAAGSGAMSEALARIPVLARIWHEGLQEEMTRLQRDTPDAPADLYERFAATAIAWPAETQQRWLDEALRTPSTWLDTHPSLSERMTALKATPELPTHAPDATALALCGPLGPTLLKWCDDEWQAENAVAWRKRHDAIKEARWKISQYENTAAEQLQPTDLWEKALLLLDIGRQDDAVEELRGLVARDPSVARAQFLLGRLLLEEGDEKGLSNLTAAAKEDAELIEPAGHLGYGYLIERGRRGEAQRFWERIQAA
jgi:hypothetical protein